MVRTALALCALSVSVAAIAAPESLSKVDTSKGQILLEIQANGTAMRRVSKVTTACTLQGYAETKKKALDALKDEQSELKKAFASAGIAASALDFSAQPSTNNRGYPMVIEAVEVNDAAVEAADTAAEAAGDAVAKIDRPSRSEVYSQRVGVTVTSLTAMEKARDAMNDVGCDEDYRAIRRPDMEIADAASGKTEATANAIKAARAQAENYAAALNMTVVGMIRVSETGMIKEFLGAESDMLMQEMRGEFYRNRLVSDDVPITASVLVDFVLGPK